MNINLEIEGGRKLRGQIRVNAAKNSAVALIAAALLNHGQTRLENVPKIADVERLLEVLASLGVKIAWQGNTLNLRPATELNLAMLDTEAVARAGRSALLLLAVLAHRAGTITFPRPGGCRLGERSVLTHLLALAELGIKIKETTHGYHIASVKPRATEIVLAEMSDTATEQALLGASLINGQTTLRFASSNYMVQDLCHFLVKLGVKIEGIGTSTLIISGVKKIEKNVNFAVGEDPIEAMLFLAIAATTNSTLTIERAPLDFLELELLQLRQMGWKYQIVKKYVSENGYTRLGDIVTAASKLVAPPEKIHPLPYPGINIDNLPFFVPIATQARGRTLIHDWVYENRAVYYLELNKLGADIVLADSHRVFVNGPSALRAAEVICPPALRPAAIILIGMLAARGTSLLRNIYSINRGYEDLVNRLKKLGAKIKVVE